jgi:hypothetical protein
MKQRILFFFVLILCTLVLGQVTMKDAFVSKHLTEKQASTSKSSTSESKQDDDLTFVRQAEATSPSAFSIFLKLVVFSFAGATIALFLFIRKSIKEVFFPFFYRSEFIKVLSFASRPTQAP